MTEKFTQGDWSVHNPRFRRPSLNPKAPPDGRHMVIHPDGERVLAVCNIGYCGRDGSIPLEEREANNSLTVSPDAKREANTSGGIGSP